MKNHPWRFLSVYWVLCTAYCVFCCGCRSSETRVVLYCAQDREFADTILDDFTHSSGLSVQPRYDTEANKSVSLYQDLVREAKHPRCDVHWNNEILATIRLQRQGLLEPYHSPSAEAFPDVWKAKDGTWTAFAARARVLIVNTKHVPKAEWPRRLLDLTEPRWQKRVAMANPQFGTTATHAACLFAALGKEDASRFFVDLKKNVVVVAGNKQVAERVGLGQYHAGITDTDDAIAEVEAGRDVAIIFPDRDAAKESPWGTLFLPNTVAMIRGCPNPEGAKKLIDYLLTPEVEAKLARTASHQIPLNPQVKAELPAMIETPRTVKPMRVDFERAADVWDEVLAFLRKEFGRP